METRVKQIYKQSWITTYYDYEIKSEDGIVFFVDNKNNPVLSNRFIIYVYIPKITKPYFYSLQDWKNIASNSETLLTVGQISNVEHGFRTKSFPTSKSLFYTSPYFFVVRTPSNISSNCLLFNSFLNTNSEDKILAAVEYIEEQNEFKIFFQPEISFPFLNSLSLNKTLEFVLTDSNKKQVALFDYSQLFVLIKIK